MEAKAEVPTPSSSSIVVLCSCPTCGNAIVPPLTADQVSTLSGVDDVTVNAYRQKDKLLTFDREHAKRTHVNDAQSDYYESSTWLSDAEKAVLDRKEKLRRDAAKPSNRRYKMSFDLAGRRVVEVIQGDDDDESDLANDGSGASVSKEGGGSGQYDPGYEPDQLVQNDALMSENAGRIGEVYRQIRNKFANRGAATASTGAEAAAKAGAKAGAAAKAGVAAETGAAVKAGAATEAKAATVGKAAAVGTAKATESAAAAKV